jgi:hypothetical protein
MSPVFDIIKQIWHDTWNNAQWALIVVVNDVIRRNKNLKTKSKFSTNIIIISYNSYLNSVMIQNLLHGKLPNGPKFSCQIF